MYYLLELYYIEDNSECVARSVHNSLEATTHYKNTTDIKWYESLICNSTQDELRNILTYNEYISHFGIEFKANKLT